MESGGGDMTNRRWIAASLVVVAFGPLLGGCATVGVDPLDRGVLAQPEMTFEYRANDQAFDDHIYFSKEASSGGRGFGGGGCGCN
jgi:hypothetical protein